MPLSSPGKMNFQVVFESALKISEIISPLKDLVFCLGKLIKGNTILVSARVCLTDCKLLCCQCSSIFAVHPSLQGDIGFRGLPGLPGLPGEGLPGPLVNLKPLHFSNL